MNGFLRFLPYLFTMAGVTYLIRMLPLALTRKKIRGRFWQSFLHYIPYAVLSAMTFPAILYATSGYPSALVGLGVALLLAYFRRGLVVVAGASCLAVFLTEWLVKIL